MYAVRNQQQNVFQKGAEFIYIYIKFGFSD